MTCGRIKFITLAFSHYHENRDYADLWFLVLSNDVTNLVQYISSLGAHLLRNDLTHS